MSASAEFHAREWEPEKLYRTLYTFHRTGDLPGPVQNRLPVYLERLREQRADATAGSAECE